MSIMNFDINLSNGDSVELRSVACLAPLSRERTRQRYAPSSLTSEVASITLYLYRQELPLDWLDYVMSAPYICSYITSVVSTCAMHCITVRADVNPHHLMFILGVIRSASKGYSRYVLWERLVALEVHPDLAAYFSFFCRMEDYDTAYQIGDGSEYGILDGEYVSWDRMVWFAETFVNNREVPKYWTKRDVKYSKHKTYSRDGEHPVAGWLHGYDRLTETLTDHQGNDVFTARSFYGTGMAKIQELARTLISAQDSIKLRKVGDFNGNKALFG